MAHPDATEFGHTTFRANTISGTLRGFRVSDANDVTIEHNVVTGVTNGVDVITAGTDPGIDPASVVHP